MERMYTMLSMPVMFCSMTCVTVWSTVVGEAPAYRVLIWMEGEATSGYCEIGRVKMASTPKSMVTMASTHAKMG